ncbi:ISKra4 family transposase, partial [Tumidithrix helvetica]|uniref:ISKra4 family transposase n=1 Tax=Tumidithrix helvetica TaxID=3457545 RepID=UPI003CC6B7F4
AEILYRNAETKDAEQLKTLEGIEIAVREQMLENVSPNVGNFFIEKSTGTKAGKERQIKSCIGKLRIKSHQAKKLQVKARSRLSPQLEKCCLLVSASESYARTAVNVEELTGIQISHSSQQRLVQKQEFPEMTMTKSVEEISLDGGKVRLRTEKGKKSEWKDYKAVNAQGTVSAYFLNNQGLVEWLQKQPLAQIFSCLGDGHDGIWNLFKAIAPSEQRFEILDWYHLKEHLYNVGGSLRRLTKVEDVLWQGSVDEAIALFEGCKFKRAINFLDYLRNHRHRIPEYGYLQEQGITIGSGSVESTIKQIGRRVKISGAQWNRHNVAQVLKHRCAYLNGYFYAPKYI